MVFHDEPQTMSHQMSCGTTLSRCEILARLFVARADGFKSLKRHPGSIGSAWKTANETTRTGMAMFPVRRKHGKIENHARRGFNRDS